MTVFSKPALIATIIFALAVTSSNPAAAKSGGVSHSAATTTTSQAGHVNEHKSRLWKGPIQKGVAWVKKVCRRSHDPFDDFLTSMDVRYWHKADIASAPHMSAFGGKADMTFCTANVCF